MTTQEIGAENAPWLLLLKGSEDARWSLLAMGLSRGFRVLWVKDWEQQVQLLSQLLDSRLSLSPQLTVCGPMRCWHTLYPALLSSHTTACRILLEAADMPPGSFLGHELLGQGWENSLV